MRILEPKGSFPSASDCRARPMDRGTSGPMTVHLDRGLDLSRRRESRGSPDKVLVICRNIIQERLAVKLPPETQKFSRARELRHDLSADT